MTSSAAIASRVFTLGDQHEFARASGDFNPLHLDAQFARRTQMGAPVVHGMHIVLWALESLLRNENFDLKGIGVRFNQPLFLDETAMAAVSMRSGTAFDLEVAAAGTVIASIKLASGSRRVASAAEVVTSTAPPGRYERPLDVPFAEMSDQRGAVAASITDDAVCRLFPSLSNAIGPAAVTGLMATSQIVGMACPGLHSLFAGLEANFDVPTSDARTLGYVVCKTDARFRSVQIDVSGSGLSGRIDAFARRSPQGQADMKTISMRLTGTPFKGQRALVVGGSRGLGEVAAKIVAAGGGHPVITYFQSKREAEEIAAEIRQAGGTCSVVGYDVRDHDLGWLEGLGHVDSCYYFATAKIFQRKAALFEPDKLVEFLDYYVNGFSRLCEALSRRSAGATTIFYPSTTALDAPVAGTAEYAMAKAAGEALVEQLNAFQPGLKVISRRLPRIATDQTATVAVATAQDALDVLLPIVQEIQHAARTMELPPLGRS